MSGRGRRTSRRWLHEASYAGAIISFTIVFFWRVIVAADLTFITWYDNVAQYYAWMHRLADGWRTLTPPLWDFTTDAGTPFVGELQTAVFYPLNILFVWIVGRPSVLALDWLIAIHFAIGWYGFATFLRLLGTSRLAALFGGAVWMLTGPVMNRAVGQANIFAGLVYLPWVAACFLAAFRARTDAVPFLALVGGTFLGLALLAGHPQPAVHALFFLLAVAVWTAVHASGSRKHPVGRIVVILSLMGFATLCASAIQLLPSVEYFERALRWVGLTDPVAGLSIVPSEARRLYELEWRHLRSLFDVVIEGPDGGTLYITWPAVALSVIGSFAAQPARWLAAGCVAVGLLLALGSQTPVGWVNDHVPGLRSIREPVRNLCLYQAGMAMLAGLGVDLLRSLPWPRVRQAVLVAAVVLFGAQASTRVSSLPTRLDDQARAADQAYRHAMLPVLQRRVQGTGSSYRTIVEPKDLLPPNLGHVFGVATRLGHRSSMLATYYHYLAHDWTPGSDRSDRLAMRYVVSDRPFEGFVPVAAAGGLHLSERTRALPVFQFENALGQVGPLPAAAPAWTLNSVSVAYDVPERGTVVFAQMLYPGWLAVLDGEPAALGPTAEGFVEVPTPAGRHRLELHYSPSWLPVGLALWMVLVLSIAASAMLTSSRPSSYKGRRVVV